VLDICCGAGTIGLSAAGKVRRVIGVEINADNVEAAKAAAVTNGIGNCDFVCGAAEKVLEGVLRRQEVMEAPEVVAVVDPPRGGVCQRDFSSFDR
jgi:tRNA/tmRNA/rRNA uracil-C5-methylase (TrmA/RlmC/RlmD family)